MHEALAAGGRWRFFGCGLAVKDRPCEGRIAQGDRADT